MDSEKLFEDYDPDMEDVFGSNVRMTPRCITVTAEQRADPLRKPKIMLQAILVAEKQPMSVAQIQARMLEEDGRVMDPKPYGFSTLDDLLQACPDAIIHNRKFDGTHVYQPKANEANQDIVEMVKLQSDRGEEKRAPRQFFSGKRNGETRGRGNYGSSFRSYTGQKAKTSDILKGTAQQFQARTALGPPKSAGRVQNLADVLRQYRSEIGKEHPQVPGRFIVTLADLQKKFLDVYALPPWGKRMTESELFKELDCPEFAGILVFWRLKEGGDVYVEEGEGASDGVKGDKEQKVKENSAPEVAVVARNQVEVVPTKLNCSMSSSCPEGSLQSGNLFSSVGDESDDSNILLEEEDMADGFFESGPGFGGGMNSRATSQAGQHHQLPPPPPSPAQIEREKFAEIASRFGAAPLSPVQQKQKPLRKPDFPATAKSDVTNFSGRSSYGFNSQDTSLEQISDSAPSPAASSRRIPAMRPIDVSFSSRSITPPNPMKVLADYVKSRGTCGYDTLPDDDKKLVNFSKDVFKVFATQPGEMLVRLVDPTIDTSTLAFTGNRLRDPLEADMRWMADTTRGMRVGRQFVTPVMFIAPRGFLQLVTREEEVDEAELKIERIGTMLREYMDEETVEIDQRQVRPGMPAVYIYREDTEVRYYRVLVLGHAHNEGDVLVLLADLDTQYFVDVQLSQLFEMPEKAGFKEYPSNVVFATLHGVVGLSEEEQLVMWKNIDEEERKKTVVAYLGGEKGKMPFVDMIWRDELGQLSWLSQIAKRRGAMMHSDTDSVHLRNPAASAIPPWANEQDNVMEFTDCGPRTRHESESNSEREELQGGVSPIFDTEPTLSPHPSIASASTATPSPPTTIEPFSASSLDLYALFDKASRERNMAMIFSLVQFARNVAPMLGNRDDWDALIGYMLAGAEQEHGLRL